MTQVLVITDDGGGHRDLIRSTRLNHYYYYYYYSISILTSCNSQNPILAKDATETCFIANITESEREDSKKEKLTDDCEIDARVARLGFTKVDSTPIHRLVG